MKNEFGQFVENKRIEKGISLRGFAGMIDIAPAYMSDLEKGRRNPPETDKLNLMVTKLNLNEKEKQTFFDLAGMARKHAISPDLHDYVMDANNANVRYALRVARDIKADDKVWQEVIKILEERKRNGG